MGTRRGFTLTDLIGLLVVLVLAVVVFLPACRSAHQDLSGRRDCAMNLSNLGKAIALYKNANNDQYPHMDAPAMWDTARTGTNRADDPAKDTPHAVTALMFMLLRDGGQSAKTFCCPSDTSVAEDVNVKDATGKFCWDFSSARNCSYGFQVPLADGSCGASDANPYTIIMADKAPGGDLGGYVAGAKPTTYMSPNHESEYINALRADSSVINSKTPDCGDKAETKDYIYTASGNAAGGNQYGGTASQAAHLSLADSCVMGPR